MKNLIFIVAVSLCSNPVFSQWNQTHGPEGAYVNVLFSDNDNLYIGCSNNIWVSTDQGTGWQMISNGLPAYGVMAIIRHGGNLFAGTWGGGVFTSTDEGLSWIGVNNGLTGTGLKVTALTSNGTYLFAGTSDYISDGGIFRSSNNGTSWSAVNNGLTVLDIRKMVASGSAVLAGTSQCIFRSVNNGSSWTQVGCETGMSTITGLKKAGSVFAIDFFSLFISTNNGADWQSSWDSANTIQGQRVSITASENGIFIGTGYYPPDFGGIYRSTNYGESWTIISNQMTPNYFSALETHGSYIFAGTDGGGIYRSSDNGNSWNSAAHKLYATSVNSFAVLGNTVFAGVNGGGVYRTTDAGLHWLSSSEGLNSTHVTSLTVNGTTLFASTYGEGIFKSTDQGGSWFSANNGVSLYMNCLKTYDGVVWAGGSGYSVYASIDNGLSWQLRNTGISSINIKDLAVSGNHIFAGTNAGGVFYSSDSGLHWTALNMGLSNTKIRALLIYGDKVLTGTNGGGIFVTTINGSTWTPKNNGITDSVIVSLFSYGSHLFAGSAHGVYLSNDSGETWINISHDLPDVSIRNFCESDGNLYAGTASRGVFTAPISSLVEVSPAHNKRTENFYLHQNYPNPFNPITSIKYSLPVSGTVSLIIFNALGQPVKTLVHERINSGHYETTWNGNDNNGRAVSSGIYICRLQFGSLVKRNKMLLLK